MDDKKIKAHTDKRGKEHIDIYSDDPKKEHSSIHINLDTKTGKGTIVDNTSGTKETTNTQCYLTTACMSNMQETFDDKCEELQILRWFRDHFVSYEDIIHYYRVAPSIVESINKIKEKDEVYSYIYTKVVKECVEAIKKGDYEFAYNRYKYATLTLEEQYTKPIIETSLSKVLKKKKI